MASERHEPWSESEPATDRAATAPAGAETDGSTEREDDARDVIDETLPADRADWEHVDASSRADEPR